MSPYNSKILPLEFFWEQCSNYIPFMHTKEAKWILEFLIIMRQYPTFATAKKMRDGARIYHGK